jgi:hypothetical protein
MNKHPILSFYLCQLINVGTGGRLRFFNCLAKGIAAPHYQAKKKKKNFPVHTCKNYTLAATQAFSGSGDCHAFCLAKIIDFLTAYSIPFYRRKADVRRF